MQPVTLPNSSLSWVWIWKLKLPEKIKFLVWLACHNSVPTISLLNHRNIAPTATCSRCNLHVETFLHCVHDCHNSKNIWQHSRFNDP
uniref:RNA-directed DNA polymerase; Ribonuclease H, putative n=1 Tax=Medicago truncatula TaxID=3880 RepID=A2Q4Z8_MEDTR|nr:RNA-directed DNA polymerase; Ribonuclease H, putative [Medicago truncatula]